VKLSEAIKKKQTRSNTDTAFDSAPDLSVFTKPRSKTKDSPLASQTKRKQSVQPEPTLKTSSAAQTADKLKGVNIPAQGINFLRDLMSKDIVDEIPDDELDNPYASNNTLDTIGVDPIPKTPENLPAVINKQIALWKNVEPEWSMVKHLPGYFQTAIRAVGRQVFGAYTKIPLEKIQVLANLNGAGPNDDRELNAAAGWIKHTGVRDSVAELDFEQSMPGYKADVQIWNAEGYQFMIVYDFAGKYVYAWPSNKGVRISNQSHPRLEKK